MNGTRARWGACSGGSVVCGHVAAIMLRATAPAESARNTPTAVAELLGANASAIAAANTTAVILLTTSSLVASDSTLNATAVSGNYAQSALTDTVVLSKVAAVFFLVWLLSLVAFFLLAKREFRPTLSKLDQRDGGRVHKATNGMSNPTRDSARCFS